MSGANASMAAGAAVDAAATIMHVNVGLKTTRLDENDPPTTGVLNAAH